MRLTKRSGNEPYTSAYTRGFSLAELLTVASIIGVLAMVVLVNVTDGRNRANDNAIKANMATIQVEAEVFNYQTTVNPPYVGNPVLKNSYGASVATGFCLPNGGTTLFGGDAIVKAAIIAIGKIVGGTKPPNMVCSSNIADVAQGLPASYAISIPLSSGKYWCVDSQGAAGERDNPIVVGVDRQCP